MSQGLQREATERNTPFSGWQVGERLVGRIFAVVGGKELTFSRCAARPPHHACAHQMRAPQCRAAPGPEGIAVCLPKAAASFQLAERATLRPPGGLYGAVPLMASAALTPWAPFLSLQVSRHRCHPRKSQRPVWTFP